MKLGIGCVVVGFLSLVLSLAAQTSGNSRASAQAPPPLIQFSNVATDEGGNTLSGVVNITFSLYNAQQGGESLWTEIQNDVQLDATGHYSVQLGITQPSGVPKTLFTTGEAHWLGVQIAQQPEQARVLLLSVPYALKAGDAATIGGLPPSAFVLAAPGTASSSSGAAATNSAIAPTDVPALSGGGTTDYVPLWLNATKLGNSKLFQSAAGNVGLGTKTPAATLDVNGAINAATSFNLGGVPFGYGCPSCVNAFAGFAGNSAITGSNDTGMGVDALKGNTSGSQNTAVGSSALQNNVSGSSNTAVGTESLWWNSFSSANTALGFMALSGINFQDSNPGCCNTAVGAAALDSNDEGQYNTAIGYSAGSPTNFTTGSNDTYLGANATLGVDEALNNSTAVGANALVTTSNAMVLGSINGVNGATASVNVGIGTTAPKSLLTVTGSDTTANGFGAALQISNTASGGGNWYLRSGATGNSTPVGGLSIANDNQYAMEIEANGYVGILTNTATPPDMPLTVNGGADKPGGGSWATFSDRRLKNLDGSFHSGLSQIMQLSPILYRYKADNAMGIRDQEEHVGLVAQDVQKVVPEAVTENSKGYLLVNNDPIIWSMLNAIKEQQREIRALKSELRATRQTLQKVEVRVAGTQPALVAAKQTR